MSSRLADFCFCWPAEGPVSQLVYACPGCWVQVYGLGGVGIVVEALSDNNARAAATVRDVVKKAGAKMADSGSVLFNFKRCVVPQNSNGRCCCY